MEGYTVQKDVRHQARVLGLKYREFFILLTVFVMMAMSLMGNFSWRQFLTSVMIIVLTYVILIFMQNVDFGKYLSNLPKVLINR